MDYNFREIEAKWQKEWRERDIYRVEVDPSRPKFYVLDMFPYPSGAGLHVGHPLGYIASDIYSRYKRLCGYNVLHPMGYDAFGLPAEQYAIQTGQHPAVTTDKNITRYREQLGKIVIKLLKGRSVSSDMIEFHKTAVVRDLVNNASDKVIRIDITCPPRVLCCTSIQEFCFSLRPSRGIGIRVYFEQFLEKRLRAQNIPP